MKRFIASIRVQRKYYQCPAEKCLPPLCVAHALYRKWFFVECKILFLDHRRASRGRGGGGSPRGLGQTFIWAKATIWQGRSIWDKIKKILKIIKSGARIPKWRSRRPANSKVDGLFMPIRYVTAFGHGCISEFCPTCRWPVRLCIGPCTIL